MLRARCCAARISRCRHSWVALTSTRADGACSPQGVASAHHSTAVEQVCPPGLPRSRKDHDCQYPHPDRACEHEQPIRCTSDLAQIPRYEATDIPSPLTVLSPAHSKSPRLRNPARRPSVGGSLRTREIAPQQNGVLRESIAPRTDSRRTAWMLASTSSKTSDTLPSCRSTTASRRSNAQRMQPEDSMETRRHDRPSAPRPRRCGVGDARLSAWNVVPVIAQHDASVFRSGRPQPIHNVVFRPGKCHLGQA